MQTNNTPIDVICVCSADGEIRPLRFRVENEECRFLRVDIDEIISTREVQQVGIESRIYLCRAVIEGFEWIFELKYHIRTHSWRLLRRVY